MISVTAGTIVRTAVTENQSTPVDQSDPTVSSGPLMWLDKGLCWYLLKQDWYISLLYKSNIIPAIVLIYWIFSITALLLAQYCLNIIHSFFLRLMIVSESKGVYGQPDPNIVCSSLTLPPVWSASFPTSARLQSSPSNVITDTITLHTTVTTFYYYYYLQKIFSKLIGWAHWRTIKFRVVNNWTFWLQKRFVTHPFSAAWLANWL